MNTRLKDAISACIPVMAVVKRLDFKVGKGGLADIDFAMQLIQIREGGARPEFRIQGTRRLLLGLPATRFLTEGEASELCAAHRFLRSLELMVRMDSDTSTSWIPADPQTLGPLAVRLGFARPGAGDAFLAQYRTLTTRVREIYLDVVERLMTAD